MDGVVAAYQQSSKLPDLFTAAHRCGAADVTSGYAMPSFVFCLEDADEIVGFADQHCNDIYNAGEPVPPTLLLPLPPGDVRALRRAKEHLQRAVDVLVRIDALAEQIAGVPEHARHGQHRIIERRRRGRPLIEVLT
jgi:hypothetical protein